MGLLQKYMMQCVHHQNLWSFPFHCYQYSLCNYLRIRQVIVVFNEFERKISFHRGVFPSHLCTPLNPLEFMTPFFPFDLALIMIDASINSPSLLQFNFNSKIYSNVWQCTYQYAPSGIVFLRML